jgi:hypothetical protein
MIANEGNLGAGAEKNIAEELARRGFDGDSVECEWGCHGICLEGLERAEEPVSWSEVEGSVQLFSSCPGQN